MIISPEAEAELASAQGWYDQQRQGLGVELVAQVEATLQRIDRTPQMHGTIYQDVRRAVVRRFPYVVYYRIVDGEAVVIAIVHGSRDPKTWQSRV